MSQAPPATPPRRRPAAVRLMHVTRRLHLYTGLFLLPWAVLYGVTAFLFNHPMAFADVPTRSFGRAELVGTPLETAADPGATADAVVAELNRRSGGATYTRAGPPPAYLREFAFATVNPADGSPPYSMLFEATGSGGTARRQPPPGTVPPPAPFATVPARPAPRVDAPDAGVRLPDTLSDRIKAAAPVVAARVGFPPGAVAVTSVPDLGFTVTDGQTTWAAAYNAHTGTVTGRPGDAGPGREPLSARGFLLRLHLAHGYPGAGGARWWWALVVDAMAFVMVFWGVSGLFMWWQVKAARRAGAVVLVLSAAAATALGVGMHAAIDLAH